MRDGRLGKGGRVAKSESAVGRRRFLKGAAVSAAALVARNAPVDAAPQDQAAARPAGAPAAPVGAQLRADTEPPPTGASPRLVEKPASDFMVDVIKTRSEERRVGKSVDLGGRRIIKKKKGNITRLTIRRHTISKSHIRSTRYCQR